jgi:RNA polymerase sigma-70 factor (ECF subfamily)
MTSDHETFSPFPATRWSLIVSNGENREAVMNELCQLYWQPLYTFARRTGLAIEDAEDITQRFFQDLMHDESTLLQEANPGAGKLRTLFLRVLQRRISDHRRHQNRAKRGGGTLLSLDTQAAEAGLQVPSNDTSPEAAFDRQWALNVLQHALGRLEKDFTSAGRSNQFAALTPFLGLSNQESSYDRLQQTLQITETAARQSVHRFRERFRRHLRAEIAETLAAPDEAAIDHELMELRTALSCG